MSSVKELIETSCLTSIPSKYVLPPDPHDIIVSEAEVIPTIDLSLFTSGTPDQRSNVIQELGHACREWGFFMVKRAILISCLFNLHARRLKLCGKQQTFYKLILGG